MLSVSPQDVQEHLDSTPEILLDTATFPDGRQVTRAQSTPVPIPLPPGDVNLYDSWRHIHAKLADVGVGTWPPHFYHSVLFVLIKASQACMADKVDQHFTDLIQSPALRAPEVCIGAGWGKPADIWSVGCVVRQLSLPYV